MSFKTRSIYAAPISAALIVLALWAGGKSDDVNQTASPPQQQAAQHPQIAERPAATPASVAEWAEIQKFVRDIWTIAGRQGQAQGRLKTTVATLATRFDLNGIRKAQIKYRAQLDDALAALAACRTLPSK